MGLHSGQLGQGPLLFGVCFPFQIFFFQFFLGWGGWGGEGL